MPSILPCGWSLHCSPIRVWTDTCVDTQWAGRAQRAGVCHLLGSRRVKPSTALYRLPTTQETKPQHFCLQLSQYIYIYTPQVPQSPQYIPHKSLSPLNIYPTSPSVPSIQTDPQSEKKNFRQLTVRGKKEKYINKTKKKPESVAPKPGIVSRALFDVARHLTRCWASRGVHGNLLCLHFL